MAVPPEGEEMHILPRENPPPRLLANAISKTPASLPEVPLAEPTSTESRSPWRFVAVLVSVLMAAAAIALGIARWGGHETREPSRPLSVSKPIPQKSQQPSPSRIRVSADQLRVSAIALGEVRLAIVNGQRLEEGSWLEVRTPEGVAALRVVKIDDGVVHFGYAGETIDAKLSTEAAAKSPR